MSYLFQDFNSNNIFIMGNNKFLMGFMNQHNLLNSFLYSYLNINLDFNKHTKDLFINYLFMLYNYYLNISILIVPLILEDIGAKLF
jgi:hypothetical protein